MTKGRVVLAALAVAIAGLVFNQTFTGPTANAQYPPPQGSMICLLSGSSSSSLVLTITLRDTAGNAVVGEPVKFSVTGDAKLSPYSATTNHNGQAQTTVAAGSFVGGITISANTDVLECRSVAEVLSVSVRPPSTGDAGLLGRQGDNAYLMLGGLVLTLLAAAAVAVSLKRATVR
jgi:hypothetical protein